VIGEPDEDDNCKGSGRSVRPLNIYESLKTADTYLENFGGHKFACGLSIRQDSIDDFKGKMSFKRATNPAAYERVQFMKHFSGIE
jgi:single-stranded DNA-specific DHH superfamily exonuclease